MTQPHLSHLPRRHPASAACGPAERTDPRLEIGLRHVLAIGVVLVLLLPAARGSHAALGWLPLWLLGMPLSAWWAVHRFALPGANWLRPGRRTVAAPRVRRNGPPARRRQRPGSPATLPRAA